MLPLPAQAIPRTETRKKPSGSSSPRTQPRSAVIIRIWHQMEWTPNVMHYMRSVIQELSLHSGGEYEVFILVHVKDDTPIYADSESVKHLKEAFIPPEFRDMVVFFNDQTLFEWYPNVPEHEYVSSSADPLHTPLASSC